MKMDIEKVVSETFRLGLQAPKDYLEALRRNPLAVDHIANGVGSEGIPFLYHLTPDTILGLNINPGSHIHDWMYVYPKKFISKVAAEFWKRMADAWFLANVKILIADSWGWICRQYRTLIINFYYQIVQNAGWSSFSAGREKGWLCA